MKSRGFFNALAADSNVRAEHTLSTELTSGCFNNNDQKGALL